MQNFQAYSYIVLDYSIRYVVYSPESKAMGFLRKTISWQGNAQVRRYYLMGLPFFTKKKGESQTCWLFGVRLFSRKRRRKHSSLSMADRVAFAMVLKKEICTKERIVLWIDHSLGGGTEVYSLNHFREVKETMCVIRFQYFPGLRVFRLSLPTSTVGQFVSFDSLDEAFNFVTESAPLDELVVNNLVGYPNSLAVLEQVIRIKNELLPRLRVSFRGHDFQSVCPSFNLLNSEMYFCNLSHPLGCENCLRSVHLGRNEEEDTILMSGAASLASWRSVWGRFFDATLDEFIAFSEEIARIFFRVYPQLEGKTRVVPHRVPPLRKVRVPAHSGINIGILGNISLIQKGRLIVDRICKLLPSYPDVRLVILGDYLSQEKCAQLRVLGHYKRDELPSLVEKERVDVVLIPSIWPETFSYTTAEAMSMDLPVACFALGAPYERVRRYPRGLILDSMEGDLLLKQIIQFVQNMRKE